MSDLPLQHWLEGEKQAGRIVRKRKLAAELGCSPSRITQLLNGDQPSLGLAAKLSQRTGIPMDKFVRQKEAAE